MKIQTNVTTDYKDKEGNVVVKIELFPESTKSDTHVVRVTNYIYGNSCVKKQGDFESACETFDKECEKYRDLLEKTQTEKLIFRNRYLKRKESDQ